MKVEIIPLNVNWAIIQLLCVLPSDRPTHRRSNRFLLVHYTNFYVSIPVSETLNQSESVDRLSSASFSWLGLIWIVTECQCCPLGFLLNDDEGNLIPFSIDQC